jgi:hypothetical protein
VDRKFHSQCAKLVYWSYSGKCSLICAILIIRQRLRVRDVVFDDEDVEIELWEFFEIPTRETKELLKKGLLVGVAIRCILVLHFAVSTNCKSDGRVGISASLSLVNVIS